MARWKRNRPARSRLPIPLPVLAPAAVQMWKLCKEIALVLMLSLYLYLRPSEVWKLSVQDMVSPVVPDMPHWQLTLHSFEAAIPIKTQEFDEVLALDLPHQSWLGPVLVKFLGTRIPTDPWFQCGRSHFGRVWKLATQRLDRLPDLGPMDLHRAFHSGASLDFVNMNNHAVL